MKYYWFSYRERYINSDLSIYIDSISTVHPFSIIGEMRKQDKTLILTLLNYKEITKEERDLYYKQNK